MSINIEDYILLAITNGEAEEEKEFLKTEGFLPSEWSILKLDKDGCRIGNNNMIPSFLFVNQASWGWLGEGVIEDLNSWQKKVVIYTHIGNKGIPESRLKEIVQRICFLFHHGDLDGMRLMNFLRLITEQRELFVEVLRGFIIESLSEKISYPLAILLPLDIDMQTLRILAEKKKQGEKVKDPKDYLKEMYEDNVNYGKKLLDLRENAKELISRSQGILDKLCGVTNGKVWLFFEMLDERELNPEKLLHHDWGVSGVNSFHDWYCALAEFLRDL
jgi:hypothetical protein